MPTFTPCLPANPLPAGHRALCREYAAVQERCSRAMAQQRAEIAQLQAQVLRLRAAAIVQVSAMAWVNAPPLSPCIAQASMVPGTLALLEASLAAADLVICQTGCLSHGAYWRVQDHCRRTGKQCVLVAQPDALEKVVRLHRSPALSQHTEDTEATHS